MSIQHRGLPFGLMCLLSRLGYLNYSNSLYNAIQTMQTCLHLARFYNLVLGSKLYQAYLQVKERVPLPSVLTDLACMVLCINLFLGRFWRNFLGSPSMHKLSLVSISLKLHNSHICRECYAESSGRCSLHPSLSSSIQSSCSVLLILLCPTCYIMHGIHFSISHNACYII